MGGPATTTSNLVDSITSSRNLRLRVPAPPPLEDPNAASTSPSAFNLAVPVPELAQTPSTSASTYSINATVELSHGLIEIFSSQPNGHQRHDAGAGSKYSSNAEATSQALRRVQSDLQNRKLGGQKVQFSGHDEGRQRNKANWHSHQDYSSANNNASFVRQDQKLMTMPLPSIVLRSTVDIDPAKVVSLVNLMVDWRPVEVFLPAAAILSEVSLWRNDFGAQRLMANKIHNAVAKTWRSLVDDPRNRDLKDQILAHMPHTTLVDVLIPMPICWYRWAALTRKAHIEAELQDDLGADESDNFFFGVQGTNQYADPNASVEESRSHPEFSNGAHPAAASSGDSVSAVSAPQSPTALVSKANRQSAARAQHVTFLCNITSLELAFSAEPISKTVLLWSIAGPDAIAIQASLRKPQSFAPKQQQQNSPNGVHFMKGSSPPVDVSFSPRSPSPLSLGGMNGTGSTRRNQRSIVGQKVQSAPSDFTVVLVMREARVKCHAQNESSSLEMVLAGLRGTAQRDKGKVTLVTNTLSRSTVDKVMGAANQANTSAASRDARLVRQPDQRHSVMNRPSGGYGTDHFYGDTESAVNVVFRASAATQLFLILQLWLTRLEEAHRISEEFRVTQLARKSAELSMQADREAIIDSRTKRTTEATAPGVATDSTPTLSAANDTITSRAEVDAPLDLTIISNFEPASVFVYLASTQPHEMKIGRLTVAFTKRALCEDSDLSKQQDEGLNTTLYGSLTGSIGTSASNEMRRAAAASFGASRSSNIFGPVHPRKPPQTFTELSVKLERTHLSLVGLLSGGGLVLEKGLTLRYMKIHNDPAMMEEVARLRQEQRVGLMLAQGGGPSYLRGSTSIERDSPLLSSLRPQDAATSPLGDYLRPQGSSAAWDTDVNYFPAPMVTPEGRTQFLSASIPALCLSLHEHNAFACLFDTSEMKLMVKDSAEKLSSDTLISAGRLEIGITPRATSIISNLYRSTKVTLSETILKAAETAAISTPNMPELRASLLGKLPTRSLGAGPVYAITTPTASGSVPHHSPSLPTSANLHNQSSLNSSPSSQAGAASAAALLANQPLPPTKPWCPPFIVNALLPREALQRLFADSNLLGDDELNGGPQPPGAAVERLADVWPQQEGATPTAAASKIPPPLDAKKLSAANNPASDGSALASPSVRRFGLAGQLNVQLRGVLVMLGSIVPTFTGFPPGGAYFLRPQQAVPTGGSAGAGAGFKLLLPSLAVLFAQTPSADRLGTKYVLNTTISSWEILRTDEQRVVALCRGENILRVFYNLSAGSTTVTYVFIFTQVHPWAGLPLMQDIAAIRQFIDSFTKKKGPPPASQAIPAASPNIATAEPIPSASAPIKSDTDLNLGPINAKNKNNMKYVATKASRFNPTVELAASFNVEKILNLAGVSGETLPIAIIKGVCVPVGDIVQKISANMRRNLEAFEE
eukprot:GILI01007760.1.p1 GENE.GILI01007760.1~~GILI01007760.1.p1  ORF type:complete len:1590 (+),score=343.47 GILI01007760.1:452-4771(+)